MIDTRSGQGYGCLRVVFVVAASARSRSWLTLNMDLSRAASALWSVRTWALVSSSTGSQRAPSQSSSLFIQPAMNPPPMSHGRIPHRQHQLHASKRTELSQSVRELINANAPQLQGPLAARTTWKVGSSLMFLGRQAHDKVCACDTTIPSRLQACLAAPTQTRLLAVERAPRVNVNCPPPASRGAANFGVGGWLRLH